VNTQTRFAASDLFLWSLCGFVWWSWAHLMIVFIPGNLWLAGGPAIVVGAVLGLVAYLRFVTDVRNGLPLKMAYVRVNVFVFILGALSGAVLGWMSAMGNTAGPASVLPGYRFPPMTGARFSNAAVCGVVGLVASSGMMFVLGRYGHRPRLLLGALLGVLVLLYVVVPLVFIQTSGGR
jgi:hypothetical protein